MSTHEPRYKKVALGIEDDGQWISIQEALDRLNAAEARVAELEAAGSWRSISDQPDINQLIVLDDGKTYLHKFIAYFDELEDEGTWTLDEPQPAPATTRMTLDEVKALPPISDDRMQELRESVEYIDTSDIPDQTEALERGEYQRRDDEQAQKGGPTDD